MKSLLLCLCVLICNNLTAQDVVFEPNPEIRTKSSYHKDSQQLQVKYQYYYDYWSQQETK